ncbi:MAG: hypothetical protein ACKN85_05955 [Pirellula sp.]
MSKLYFHLTFAFALFFALGMVSVLYAEKPNIVVIQMRTMWTLRYK